MNHTDPHRHIVRRARRATTGLAILATAGMALIGEQATAGPASLPATPLGEASAPAARLTPSQVGPVNQPCSGVQIRVGQAPQALLDAYPAGTRFCFAAGTHRIPYSRHLTPKYGQVLAGAPGAALSGAVELPASSWIYRGGGLWSISGFLPDPYTAPGQCENQTVSDCTKTEQLFVNNAQYVRVNSKGALGPGTFYTDHADDRVWLKIDPRSHYIELSRTRLAIQASAGAVRIENLIVQRFAPYAQRGAIELGDDAVVSNVFVRNSHAHGIFLNGADRAQVLDSVIANNGQLGIGQYRSRSTQLRRNRIWGNNTDGFWVADWESGGIKTTHSSGVIASNDVRYNRGVGIWADVEVFAMTISSNVIYANLADGVRYEISSTGLITSNYVSGNGFNTGRGATNSLWDGAGINVNTSNNVYVEKNTIIGNRNAVSLQSRTRGTGSNGLPYKLYTVAVRQNRIDVSQTPYATLGIVGNSASPPGYFLYWGNTYTLGAIQTRFNRLGRIMTPYQWRATGQDPGSTFN